MHSNTLFILKNVWQNLVSLILCSIFIYGISVEYTSDDNSDNGTHKVEIKAPVFRDEESFEAMYQ